MLGEAFELVSFSLCVALAAVIVGVAARRGLRWISPAGGPIDPVVVERMKASEMGVAALVGFVLALSLNSARELYGQANDVAVNESLEALRLGRILRAIDEVTTRPQREQLRAYTQSVVDQEWETLSRQPAVLSDATDARLDALRDGVETMSRGMDVRVRERLNESLVQLEHLRFRRLEIARRDRAHTFWLDMALVLALGAIASGHFEWTVARAVAYAIYWLAIGLVIWLLLEFQQPYSGWLRIDPAILLNAVQ